MKEEKCQDGGEHKAVGRTQTKYMKKREMEIETGSGAFYEMSWFRHQNELEGIWVELVDSESESRHRGDI